jgi:hypothetical protein
LDQGTFLNFAMGLRSSGINRLRKLTARIIDIGCVPVTGGRSSLHTATDKAAWLFVLDAAFSIATAT